MKRKSNNQREKAKLIGWLAVCFLFFLPLFGPIYALQAQPVRSKMNKMSNLYVSNENLKQDKLLRISINANKVPLISVLKEVAKKAQVGISYQSDMIPDKLITVHLKNVTVYQALKEILKTSQLMAVLPHSKDVLVIKQRPAKVEAIAQTGSITGTVTNAQGEPIPTANVFLVEISRGDATNLQGKYTIEDVEEGTYTLRVSFVGYEEYRGQVTIEAGETIEKNVTLQRGAVSLDELVVTGFGTVAEDKFTGSASQITAEELEDVPVTSVTQALKGAAPGLRLTSPSGTPGSVQQILIRGISSINTSTSPLFVIDGVPVISGGLNTATSSSLGALSLINPSNIKSLTVLKGASATALYGARGSNGVIVITTKEGGRNQKTRYTVSVRRGVVKRAIDGPKRLNAEQWDELYTESLINAGVDPSDAQSPWDGTTDTDWKKLITRDQAISANYVLSASGGNDKMSFYASTNYNKTQGIAKGSSFQRGEGQLSISYDLSEAATLSNKTIASAVKQDGQLEGGAQYGNPVYAAYELLPIFKPYNEDGTPNINLNSSIYNPLWLVKHDIDITRAYRILNNTAFNLNILDNLMFTSKLGLDLLFSERKSYDNLFEGDGVQENGRVFTGYTRTFNYTWQNSLKYNWQVNEDNHLDIMVLQQAQQNQYLNQSNGAEGFATTGLTNAASAGTPTDAYSFANDWAILAFMGNVRYSFKDKYNLQATYRMEANSRFAEGHRWGSFFSVGAGWVLTEENFLSGTEDWLSFLKLRVTYGKTGNAGIGINAYQSFLGFGNSYNGRATIQQNQLGNPDLTWEKATSFEAGLNFELFNRVRTKLTFFNKVSTDLLLDVPISYTTGHDAQLLNLGRLYNQGAELSFNVDVIQSENMLWSMGINYTHVKNEVTDMPEDGNGNPIRVTSSRQFTGVEGYGVGSWYMRSWAGVDPQTGKPLWYKNVTDADGNITGRTTTSNYNDADRYYQGASQMPTDFGAINTHFSFKGFYLDASLYYSFGNKAFDDNIEYMISDGRNNGSRNQFLTAYTDRWQKPGDHAKHPQIIDGGNSNSTDDSSRWLYDDDYLRLSSMRIGYNIPPSLLSRLNVGLSSMTVYFTGRNLWTYTYDEDLLWDPEVSQSGYLDTFQSPIKTISFGIKANF